MEYITVEYVRLIMIAVLSMDECSLALYVYLWHPKTTKNRTNYSMVVTLVVRNCIPNVNA